MDIASIRHKALRRFAETGNAKGLLEPERIRDMLAFVAQADSVDDLCAPPNFGFHALRGDRAETFAMTVTRNFRLTFTMQDGRTIADLDLEDYH
ncbi:type II toxin-antitoxin system RelE/ParE family toxin [Sphingomonas sp.]|uniref:type II toxin-antitoxin system RelE/ParE family toxin n=1 Tax=Sphingomonas sp. TaxID=28214 RepID=UPI002DBE5677|nr:type II toxin-antitoxin system RelE/ParE family toxin [Sphingomonas sp.]HEU4970070.1 type II toxin-antitoxin system RelE/ParE family toxin [Sphingomonas sp.]